MGVAIFKSQVSIYLSIHLSQPLRGRQTLVYFLEILSKLSLLKKIWAEVPLPFKLFCLPPALLSQASVYRVVQDGNEEGEWGTCNHGQYSKVPTSSCLIDKRAETDKKGNLTSALEILSHINI